MSVGQSAALFTAYGVTIAISSWLSGILTESFGPRKRMSMGAFALYDGYGRLCRLGAARS